MVKSVLVIGGGSAGFLAAITLKARIRDLAVTLVRSKDIGIIGVGEGSTGQLTRHLHGYLGIEYAEFFRLANPIWKLGIRFIWGPRPFFDYSFGLQMMVQYSRLTKPNGYYCDFDGAALEYVGIGSALMSHNKAFARRPDGFPLVTTDLAYHVENEKFVEFLETYARRLGVGIVDDTITEAVRAEGGIAELRMGSGTVMRADLYLDCSGFRSFLLGKTLGEPFVSFKTSLFCDRAVVGGWQRSDEPIKPYTTAETMDSGWCWQIEHESRINRGYVYSSDFIRDEEAEREFRAKNPKVDGTRVVRFVSGRYERSWVGNVIAIGNASGFVEPLESTSLGFICGESLWLAESLLAADREVRPTAVRLFNERVAQGWDVIRQFLAIHYKFNTRLQTQFWRACQSDTDLGGAADLVECYQENGPSIWWARDVMDAHDQFTMEGYLALLVGQQVPYNRSFTPDARERQMWEEVRRQNKAWAMAGFDVPQALALVKSPGFRWPTDLYPRMCEPA